MRFIEEMSFTDKVLLGVKFYFVSSLIIHTVIFLIFEEYYERSVLHYYLNLLDLYLNYLVAGIIFLSINNYSIRTELKNLFKSDQILKKKIKVFWELNIDNKNYLGLMFLMVGLAGLIFVAVNISIKCMFS